MHLYRSLVQHRSTWFHQRIHHQCAMALPDDGLVSAVHLDADKALYASYTCNMPYKTKIALYERDPHQLIRRGDFVPNLIVSSMCVEDDMMLLGSGFLMPETRGHIRMYSLANWKSQLPGNKRFFGEPLLTLKGHRNGVRSLSYARSGHNQGLLASCSEDATVRLWDLREGVSEHGDAAGSSSSNRALHTFEATHGGQFSMGQIVAMSAEWDQGLIFAGSWSKSITCFDIRSRCNVLHISNAHDRAILALATTPSGRILSTSDDGTLREFDLRYCKKSPGEVPASQAVAIVRIADYFPTSKIIKALHLDMDKLITCHLAPPCSVVVWDSVTLEPRRIIPNSPSKYLSPIEPTALLSSAEMDLGSPLSMVKSKAQGDDSFLVGYQNRSASSKVQLSFSCISLYSPC